MIIVMLLFAWCFLGAVCFLTADTKDLNDKQFAFILAIAGPIIWVVTLILTCLVFGRYVINKVLDKLK